MTMPPFCSIVVPTYRRPGRLRDCLESLSRLEYPRDRFEVIVVDDGGGVPLAPVIDAFRDRLDLTMVAQPRSGPAGARNAGVARARGEVLVFTDDDCRPRPDWLRRLAARHSARPDEAVGGRTVNALPDNPYSAVAQLVIDVGYRQSNSGPDTARFFATNNLAVPAAGFREVGGFDPAFRTSEDRDFCSRWVASGLRMSFEPDAVVEHAHPLALGSFSRLHFEYGRGAFRYHRGERQRANRRVAIEPSYYAELARYPFRHERGGRAAGVAGLLLVWHLANTAGFLFEWGRTAVSRG